MTNRIFGLMASAAIPAFALFAAPAMAQDTASEEASGIGDIIVTAQKREERLQDVPIAITAIGSEALAKSNVAAINDLSRVSIPGLVSTSFVGGSTFTANIRGVSTQDPSQATIEAPIAIYVDGVYIPRLVGLGSEILEVERVEVLRGPQGTLFGRNAEGGAISIVSKKPSGKFEGSVGGELGSFGKKKGYVHLNLPEVANFSTKIDAYVSKRDGFTKNGPNDAVTRSILAPNQRNNFGADDSWGVRGQLQWQPSSDFTALLSGDYSKLKTSNDLFHYLLPTRLPSARVGTYAKRTPFAYYLPWVRTTAKGLQLNLTYDVADNMTVKSITAVRKLRETGGNNLQTFDGATFPSFFPGDPAGTLLSGLFSANFVASKSFSQELQLLGNSGDFEYVIGAFYFRENAEDHRGNNITIKAVPGRTPFSFPPVNLGSDSVQTVRASTFAMFAQATWTPSAFDGKLKITPGLRYTEAQKTGERTKAGSVILANPIRRTIPSVSRIDPALTVAYDVAEDVNVYVRYAQAFRDGGFSTRSAAFSTFGAETNKQVELGLKSELFDRKLRLNLAGYHSWIIDQQINQTPKDDTTAQEIVNVNGTSRLWGFEAEATVAPFRGLTISGNAALMRGKQPPYDCADPVRVPNPADRCIQQIVFLPRTSLGATVDYTTAIGDEMEAFFHFDYKWTSAFHTSPKAYPGEPWPTSHFNIAGARIGVNHVPLGPVRANISGYVDNMFDNKNVVFDTNVNFNTIQRPRQFGVAVSIDF